MCDLSNPSIFDISNKHYTTLSEIKLMPVNRLLSVST